jgi:hypothetical protein
LNYSEKIIENEGLVAHVSENSSGLKRTALDFEILSRCDELIITGGR